MTQQIQNVIDSAVGHTSNLAIRYAALMCFVPNEELKSANRRLKVPKECDNLSILVSKYLQTFLNVHQMHAEQILKFLVDLDAFRQIKRFENFVECCTIIENTSDLDSRNSTLLNKAFFVAKAVDTKKIATLYSHKNIKSEIMSARLEAIKNLQELSC